MIADLKKEDLDSFEQRLKKKEISQAEMARNIDTAQSVVSRWVRSGKPLWEKYKEYQKKKKTYRNFSKLYAKNPAGEVKTYAEHAKDLEITLLTFSRRMNNYGEDSPITWTKGKLKRVGGEKALSAGQACWEGLTSRRRDYNLDKIPSPTEYERRLWSGDL